MNRRFLAVPALLLAACSSAHSTGGVVPPAPNGRVTLTVRIPKANHSRRGARFVSPSTQSAAISIHPAAGCGSCSPSVALNAGLTPSSANCSDTLGNTTCRIELALAPGKYAGSITTYDGALGSANKPTGNVLSLNQGFPLTIVAGKANSPSIVLDGVPAALTLLPLTSSTIAYDGAALEMIGAGSSARVAAYAVDPDGNVIVGPGAPTFSAAATGGFTAGGSGSTIAIDAPPHMTQGFSTLSIVAVSPACTQPQAVCSFKVSIGFLPLVAVANSGDNDVLVFRAFLAGAYATVSQGISGPVALAFDSTGDLFVANQSSKTITEYAPPFTGSPITTIHIHNGYAPVSIAVAPNGTLAVTDDHGYVTTYAASTHTFVYALFPNYSGTQVLFDGSNDLWIGPNEMAGYSAEKFPGPGYANPSANVTGISLPATLAVDRNQNLYIAYGSAGELLKFPAPTYAPGPSVTGLFAMSSSALAADAENGTLALCTVQGLSVYSMTSLAPVSQNPAAAYCIPAFDRDADIWTIYPTLDIVAGYRAIGASWVPLQVFTTNGPTAIAVFPAP